MPHDTRRDLLQPENTIELGGITNKPFFLPVAQHLLSRANGHKEIIVILHRSKLTVLWLIIYFPFLGESRESRVTSQTAPTQWSPDASAR